MNTNNTRKITIHDSFGYEIPMNERYKLIRETGFDGVMLGWCGFPDNPHETKHLNPSLARKNSLYIENLHTPFESCNSLWLDGIDGDEYLITQLSCIDDCVRYDIPAMVIHVSGGNNPPPFGVTGLERIKRLVFKAEDNNINLAFENLRRPEYVRYILDNVKSDRVKFCFDIGHWHCRTPDEDLLKEFGGKLIALHLHDNDGTDDQHRLPYDGTIEWNEAMRNIKAIKYWGAVGLEIGNSGYETISPSDFLHLAYERAVKLRQLLDK
ncbi:MAG: sugar phosphate isomerase/epimerase family protein [Oscillospiraceae bacterium]|nr:sugar phosphate isomerase/epimerase family protein [Oscillospiraceae bacterium]